MQLFLYEMLATQCLHPRFGCRLYILSTGVSTIVALCRTKSYPALFGRINIKIEPTLLASGSIKLGLPRDPIFLTHKHALNKINKFKLVLMKLANTHAYECQMCHRLDQFYFVSNCVFSSRSIVGRNYCPSEYIKLEKTLHTQYTQYAQHTYIHTSLPEQSDSEAFFSQVKNK